MAARGDPVVPAREPVPLGYALVRSLARLLLRLFYRRIEVVGAEHVPRAGPLIIAANHHNSVVDAMLLLAIVPRRLRTLANAPLFRHPLIGPFLRLLGALPVHRRQEAGDDPARNAALFAATTATLRDGGAIQVFPEGRTQPEPLLQELRSGTARMLLCAEHALTPAVHVTLLPVGLVFHEPGTFRAGRALVLIGAPVETPDALGRAAAAPQQAARELTERMAHALRDVIVETDDRQTLRLLGVAEELWREHADEAPSGASARVAWLQRAMRTYRSLLACEPARVLALRREIEGFAGELQQAGLDCRRLSRVYTPAVVARFALRQGFALLVGAPLALAGIALHALPYRLTAAVVGRLRRTDEEEATDKIAAGLVLYPLAWLLEGWAVHRLGGTWGLWTFIAALLPAGFFALAWRERLERVAREARAFARFWRDPGLAARLRRRRQALADELGALARLAPEAWAE